MGQLFEARQFSEDDFTEFKHRLRKETALLAHWMQERNFERAPKRMGLELEGWLLDSDGQPAARNSEFLKHVDNPLVVPELSQYNFEINTPPRSAGGKCLSETLNELTTIWAKLTQKAADLDMRTLMIGSLPSLTEDMLNLNSMSQEARYLTLNQQIMRLRQGKPIHMKIEGLESIDVVHSDVMLEAASTSIQVHLQVDPDEFVNYFNASLLASPFTVAASANAPFVFGKCLWEETRIPVFEKSLELPGFNDLSGYSIKRVNFGSGFMRRSALEYYLENLDGYPILLPILKSKPAEKLAHLGLHNGTIWRWNRPIIGFSDDGQPNIRIEHRVMSAGPSLIDTVANIAMYFGVVEYYAEKLRNKDFETNFERTRRNFYSAARHGLAADFSDENGKTQPLGLHLQTEILPRAYTLLQEQGYDQHDLDTFLVELIGQRVASQRTGSSYQQQLVRTSGCSMLELVNRYYQQQSSNTAVHSWPQS